jgi:hypothetical protein
MPKLDRGTGPSYRTRDPRAVGASERPRSEKVLESQSEPARAERRPRGLRKRRGATRRSRPRTGACDLGMRAASLGASGVRRNRRPLSQEKIGGSADSRGRLRTRSVHPGGNVISPERLRGDPGEISFPLGEGDAVLGETSLHPRYAPPSQGKRRCTRDTPRRLRGDVVAPATGRRRLRGNVAAPPIRPAVPGETPFHPRCAAPIRCRRWRALAWQQRLLWRHRSLLACRRSALCRQRRVGRAATRSALYPRGPAPGKLAAADGLAAPQGRISNVPIRSGR